jgi:hypothetical protein
MRFMLDEVTLKSFFLGVSSPLIINPSFLDIHESPPLERYDSAGQAAYYHFLGLQFGGFISDPALGWLQSSRR